MKISKKLLSLLLCAVMVLGSVAIGGGGFTEVLDAFSVKASALSPTYNVSNSYRNSQYYTSLCNVNLTGNQRDDIISVALSQKGYHEGSYDGDFDGANDGAYNNYCEYNYWYHYNISTGMPVGGSELAPWCATFVSWCARQAGISTSVLQNSTAAGHGKSYFNINYAAGGSQKKDGDEARFLGNYYIPQKGDLFYTSGWTHVGLVVSVNEAQGKITTIEGNTNTSGSSNGDGVYSRTRNISDCYFGIPNYTGNAPVTKEVDPNYSKNFSATANGKYYTLTSSYSQESNRYVEPGDDCTIYEVYKDGYCFFNYPASGGRRDAYGKISWFSFSNNPVIPTGRDDYTYWAENYSGAPVALRKESYNGHTYTLYASTYTWKEAKAYCESQGGYLATITDFREAYIIKDLSSYYSGEKECVWLGADSSSGSWKWVKYPDESFSYTEWAATQPDCSGGNEFYLGFRYDSISDSIMWNDFPNSYVNRAGFIMETRDTVNNTSLSPSPQISIKAVARNHGLVETEEGLKASVSDEKRIEALALNYSGYSGGITYKAHISNVGWTDYVNGGELIGETDGTTAIEAVKIKLTGKIADSYNIYYRTYVYGTGWTGWAKNGEISGSTGGCLPITNIEVLLVPLIRYHVHVEDIGWTDAEYDGATCGTTGESKQVEAMYFKLHDISQLGVYYRTHSENLGWSNYRYDGDVSGSTGAALRTEAYQLNLHGETSDLYDVTYRAHVESDGWRSWVKNGETAGTTGESKRLEAIRAQVIPKGMKLGEATYSEKTAKIYKLTLNPNGGTCSTSSVDVDYQQLFGNMNLPTPKKTGFIFDGWYTASSGGSKILPSTIYDTEASTTIYAHWIANTFTVAYDANGGTDAPANQAKDYGTDLNLSSSQPTRTGYTFAGWNTAKDGSGTSYAAGAIYSANEDVTLYAQWEANTYTVTFNDNGGSTSTATKVVTYASTYGTLPNPSYQGYVFDGWFTAASGGTQITSDSTVTITAAQTLYAHWTAITLNSISIKSNPTKTNYYVGDTLATAGLTLTAKYSDNSTQIVSSGFTCTPTVLNTAGNQTVTVSYGGKSTTFTVYVTAVTLESIAVKTEPSKTGYYVGDSLNTTGLTLTATYNNGKTETVSSGFTCTPTTLNKAGNQVVTVSYNEKTTSFNVNVTDVVISSISIKTEATKKDYYVGDSLDTEGLTLTVNYNNGTSKTVSSGFTASADLSSTGTKTVTVGYGDKSVFYTVNVETIPVLNHTITYKVDGNVYIKATYEEGEVIQKPTNPSKSGYTFKGWSPSIPETMQNSDITVEAVFELLSYNAVFMANGCTIATVPYNINTDSISEPDVPLKTGYDGKWQSYTLTPGGITVNAVYTAKSYTVNWYINDEKTTEIYKYGEDIHEPLVSVATGYEFKGWGTTVPSKMPANNLNFTASIIPIAYTASFVANGQNIANVTYYVTTDSISEPDVPEITGYTGKWQSYALVPGGITVNAVYTINSYTVTWIINGNKTTENYKYGAIIEEPDVIPDEGYEFISWNAAIPNTMPAKNQSFTAKFSLITYYATFVADGKTVQKVSFTVADNNIIEPSVPSKTGYTGTWQNYSIKAGNITINAVYSLIEYSAKFIANGEIVNTVKYTVMDSSIIEPQIPEKAGYTGEWSKYELDVGGVTVNAVYTPNTHHVIWNVDGYKSSVEYKYGEKILKPEEPIKEGYNFVGWTPDVLDTMPDSDLQYEALFELKSFIVDIIVDGKKIGETSYTYGDTELDLSDYPVPEKVGYSGEWKYTLTADGATVTAVYTPISNPTANSAINIAPVKENVDYRSIITVKATAKNIPEGYILAMYIDGKTVKGTNTEVSYEYGELKFDLNYSVKVIDANGKVQKDSNGNELSKDSKITVNAGFFKKLIAFFRGLFKSLPKVEVKP